MTKKPTAAENKRAELRSAALDYHEFPTPGKVAVAATKQLTNQRDLALAYSPGVAAPCEEIVADPLAQAEAQLAADRSQATSALTRQIGEMAVTLAGKVVGQSLSDDARVRQTVEDFIADLERQAQGSAN